MFQLFGFWVPGWRELLIVAFIALLLFGSRLPKVMFDLGSSVRELKKGMSDSLPDDGRSEPG